MNTARNKVRRRWLQFSLRGLLLLVVILAVPLGWTMHHVRRQREAVAALEKLGCWVGYEDVDQSPVPDWLGWLLGEHAFRNVESIIGAPQNAMDWTNSQFTDAAMVHLEGFTRLKLLNLRRTSITDAGLAYLDGLACLDSANLGETQITGAGLIHLKGLRQLMWLSLDGSPVTDAGLVPLEGMTQLQVLGLEKTQVTDAALVHLHGLTKLEILDLGGSRVSYAGVEELRKILRKCQISR